MKDEAEPVLQGRFAQRRSVSVVRSSPSSTTTTSSSSRSPSVTRPPPLEKDNDNKSLTSLTSEKAATATATTTSDDSHEEERGTGLFGSLTAAQRERSESRARARSQSVMRNTSTSSTGSSGSKSVVDDEATRREWDEGEKQLDRGWYDMEEGGTVDESHDPFASVKPDQVAKKEAEMARAQAKRLSMRHQMLNEDNNRWEESRLKQSGTHMLLHVPYFQFLLIYVEREKYRQKHISFLSMCCIICELMVDGMKRWCINRCCT
jgi:hypothetical protein